MGEEMETNQLNIKKKLKKMSEQENLRYVHQSFFSEKIVIVRKN